VNPLASATLGVAGTTNPDGKVTEIVLPDARAPVDDGVNPTVQVEGDAFAVWGEPVKVTPEPAVSAAMMIDDPFASAVKFSSVLIENPAVVLCVVLAV
jgi:hypothetical protein